MNLIDGVNLIDIIMITEDHLALSWALILTMAAALVWCIVLLIKFLKNVPIRWPFLCLTIVFLILSFIFLFKLETYKGDVKAYVVEVSDEVTLNDFYNHYNILDNHGNQYIITLKEEGK